MITLVLWTNKKINIQKNNFFENKRRVYGSSYFSNRLLTSFRKFSRISLFIL